MKTICDINKCAGCGACVDVCPTNAISILDDLKTMNAVIDENKCIGCNSCKNVCQVICTRKKKKSILIKQGWALESDLRKKAASGGIASALAKTFIKDGGVVCACIYKEGCFIFDIIADETNLDVIAGSRYVKSNAETSYKKCKKLVLEGKKVLFIGLPCQVASFQNYIPVKYHDLIMTIDLICHGSPSLKLLEIFFEQYGLKLKDLYDIQFRATGKNQDYQSILKNNVMDCYMIGFLNGIFYTENCYECKYADINRVSDITLGDSWGSELCKDERDKGISLILCQSEKGISLLNNAEVVLKEVDIEVAIAHNHQLREPSPVPIKRDWFFKNLTKGKKFNSLIFQIYPIKYIKQIIKCILINIKLFSLGDDTRFCVLQKRNKNE